jgi:hypothetical protein
MQEIEIPMSGVLESGTNTSANYLLCARFFHAARFSSARALSAGQLRGGRSQLNGLLQ